jgi:malonyl CoA-acyl carrier protein transacylase
MEFLLARAGKILSRGRGTEQAVSDWWWVIKARARTEEALWERLNELGLRERVDWVEPVRTVKDGIAMIRQMPLF